MNYDISIYSSNSNNVYFKKVLLFIDNRIHKLIYQVIFN